VGIIARTYHARARRGIVRRGGVCDSARRVSAHRPPLLNAWRVRFIARVLAATLLVQLPSMVLLARWPWRLGLLGSIALHLGLSLIFVRRLVLHRDDARTPWWLPWLVETPYTAFATGAFLAAGPSALALLYGLAAGVDVTAVVAAAHVAGWCLGLWGSTVGRARAVVVRREIILPGMPAALDGLRVAQLSDVHCGPYVPRWMYRAWAARASSLGADVIALTGDLITSGEGYLDDVRDLVSRLDAPHGVVACMGNHDYFGTESGVSRAVLAGGARLLRNEGLAITRDGATLWVAGVDDRWTKRDDLAAALRDRPHGAPVLLLAHDPASFPEAVAAGVALTLSGHTHGGQIGVRNANLARVAFARSAGLFREGDSALYINRGIGTTGPPVRVGMWPEISLITLRAARS